MKRLSLLAIGFVLAACATANDDDSQAGGGGTAPTATSSSVTATATTVTTSVSSSTGGPCPQDCSTIEVPACFEAKCNLATHVCEIKPSSNDTPCDDGLFCTVNDTCQDGVCESGGPMVCTGDGADPCLTSACDEDDDTCEAVPAQNGTDCTSTDVCESNAICQNGVCKGAPKDCSATVLPDDCHVAGCDSTTGDCLVLEANNGDPCTLGDPCESNKTCNAGVCSGTPIAGCTICGEIEDNGSIGTANVDPTCTVWQGIIGTLGDQDYYGVHVSVPGSRIDAEVNDLSGPGTCPPGFEAVISLYDSTGSFLAQAEFDGAGSCGHLDIGETGSTNLPVGDYFLEVAYFFDSGTSSPYLFTYDVLPPGCGDGIAEIGEGCDGFDFAGEDCVSQGFGSGFLQCDASCNIDTSNCAAPFCGDGLVQPGELCDSFDLQGQDCISQGFGTGSLSCTAGTCIFNTSGCNPPVCGDGVTSLSEDCDGGVGLNTCASVGFGSGSLSCAADCSFNTSACNPPACGDGIVQPGEECDDGNAINTDGCTTSCLVPACAAGQTRISIGSTSVPLTINDNSTFVDTIHVTQTGTIQSLYLMMDITHTYDGDLDISLSPPGGALPGLDVTSDNGNSQQNFESTIFSSTATTSITAGSGPFTGLWLPEASFAPLNGTSVTGDWRLTVTDDAGGDVGTLNQWRIIACVN